MIKPEEPVEPAPVVPELKKVTGVVSGLIGGTWTVLNSTMIQEWVNFFQTTHDAVVATGSPSELKQVQSRLAYYEALLVAVTAKEAE